MHRALSCYGMPYMSRSTLARIREDSQMAVEEALGRFAREALRVFRLPNPKSGGVKVGVGSGSK